MSTMSPIAAPNVERRNKSRLECRCPAIVRGKTLHGKRFEEHTTLCNLSAEGMFLKLKQPVEMGMSLSVFVRLSKASPEEAQAPSIATRGIVVRTESYNDGTCGLGIRLERYHFL